MGKPGVAGPAGAAGKDGKDGKDGKPGLNGVPGSAGQVVSSDELLEFFASIYLGWHRRLPGCPRGRRSHLSACLQPGKAGKDGKNGLDGEPGLHGDSRRHPFLFSLADGC